MWIPSWNGSEAIGNRRTCYCSLWILKEKKTLLMKINNPKNHPHGYLSKHTPLLEVTWVGFTFYFFKWSAYQCKFLFVKLTEANVKIFYFYAFKRYNCCSMGMSVLFTIMSRNLSMFVTTPFQWEFFLRWQIFSVQFLVTYNKD